MIRALFIRLAREKNPSFQLDPSVTAGVLTGFLLSKGIAWLRAWKAITSKRSLLLFFGRRVSIQGAGSIHFGKAVQIGDHVDIIAWGRQGLFMGDYSRIGSHSCVKVSFSFSDPGAFIRIGKNAGIGEFAHLGGAGGLEIGDDCIIGPYFSCHPENHRFPQLNELIRLQGTERKGIQIGKNCWVGAKVTILDGVVIGDNCVIAAGAVVTKSMPSNAVIGGVPARVLRLREGNGNTGLQVSEMIA